MAKKEVTPKAKKEVTRAEKIFKTNLKKLREGLTDKKQPAVAADLDLLYQTYTHYEDLNYPAQPKYAMQEQICDYYNITMMDLYNENLSIEQTVTETIVKQNIKSLRNRVFPDLSISEFAEKFDLNVKLYTYLETGKVGGYIHFDMLEKLSRIYGVSIGDLFKAGL